jgi:hypothetical protein
MSLLAHALFPLKANIFVAAKRRVGDVGED